MEIAELRGVIEDQQRLMIQVGRYEVAIKDEAVDAAYKERRNTIRRELRRLNLEDPNPHIDLWDWYRYWKQEGLDSWVERDESGCTATFA